MDYKALFKDVIYSDYTQLQEEGGSFKYIKHGSKLKILFECSNGDVDWKNNFDFMPVSRHGGIFSWIRTLFKLFKTGFYLPKRPYKNMDKNKRWKCHRGFLRVWKAIEPNLKDVIADMDVKEIEIAGYSHGAAIALLCYEYCKFNRPDISDNINGVGFGCPRVVWGHLNNDVKKRFEGFIVIRNGRDLVTHVPPVIFGFRHIGRLIKIGERWKFKNAIDYVKKFGFKTAMSDHAFIGCVRDHYPSRYMVALDNIKN